MIRAYTNLRLYKGVETMGLTLKDTYRNVFTGGASYVHQKGMSIILGLENLTLEQGNFGVFEFLFSYSWPIGDSRADIIRTLEVVINYKFKEELGVTY
jgi:hypothetical protein